MGDQNFKQMLLFGKNLGTVSPGGGTALQFFDKKHLLRRGDGGEGVRGVFEGRKGLLDIDLNVAPPEEEDGGVCDGEGEEVAVVSHWLRGEKKANGFGFGFDYLVEEARMAEDITIGDDEKGKAETERRIRRWYAILSVAEEARNEYERNRSQNRKRRTIPVVELQESPPPKKKIPESNIDAEWLTTAAETQSPPPPVMRSTRGRAVAMPNKYRDSVLDGAVETAAFLRHNRICNKSAAVVSSKRKSR